MAAEFCLRNISIHARKVLLHAVNAALVKCGILQCGTRSNFRNTKKKKIQNSTNNYTVFNPAHCTVNNNNLTRPTYMFRPLQGHHQGGMYKGIQVQQILSKMNVCRVKIQYSQLKLL
jgi:hypothetical protein